MDFECFECGKEFDHVKFVISHLKLNHFIKNDTVAMKCLVARNSCMEEFYCFKKLKAHVKNCRFTSLSNNNGSLEPGLKQTILDESFESCHVSNDVSKQK